MSALIETHSTVNKFVIDANPRYDNYNKNDDVFLLSNVAEEVNYTTIDTTGKSTKSLAFSINNPNLFFDRGVTLNIGEIPLLFTLKAGLPTVEPNSQSYVENFFANYEDLCYKQFGFLNCIETIKVNVDGTSFTIDNVADMLKICSKYYDESVVNEKIDCSLPDIMTYKNYHSTNSAVDSVSENGSRFKIKPSISNTFSPFASLGTADYNTRQPNLIFDSYVGWSSTNSTDLNKRQMAVRATGFQCFLPFTIFSLPGEAIPLVGAKKIDLTINLKASWEKYLFGSASMVDDVTLQSGFNSIPASLNYRSYTPPHYIGALYNNGIPDYSLSCPTVEMHNNKQQVTFTDTHTVPSLEYQLRAVPKAIYIAAKVRNTGEKTDIPKADVFARIDGFNLELCGKKTVMYSNASGVYTLAKSNGLNLSKECMYLSGYPVKLNTTDDISATTNTLVGSVNNNNGNRLLITGLRLTNVANPGVPEEYEVTVTVVYDGLLSYTNGKFILYDSLVSAARELNVELHASQLYNGQMARMNNVIGGSLSGIFASAIPYLRKGMRGAYNLTKQAITNPDFLKMIKHAADGKAIEWNRPVDAAVGSGYNVTGGAFSSHSPVLGGSRNYNPY